jgi:hypothetical protein
MTIAIRIPDSCVIINLKKLDPYIGYFFFLVLIIVLSSSGIGGGTGPPEIFRTAPK